MLHTSRAAASRNTVASHQGRPMICRPIGRPCLSYPTWINITRRKQTKQWKYLVYFDLALKTIRCLGCHIFYELFAIDQVWESDYSPGRILQENQADLALQQSALDFLRGNEIYVYGNIKSLNADNWFLHTYSQPVGMIFKQMWKEIRLTSNLHICLPQTKCSWRYNRCGHPEERSQHLYQEIVWYSNLVPSRCHTFKCPYLSSKEMDYVQWIIYVSA